MSSDESFPDPSFSIENIYAELASLGVKVDVIRQFNKPENVLRDFLAGLRRLELECPENSGR